ncbi:MAG: protein-export chaperone SecB [Sphingomicrobium sp.]
MAEQETNPVTNGSGDTGTMGENGDPQISIVAQYVKDLSVENPSAPEVFQWQEQASLDVQFNIQVEKFGEDFHEVILKIDVSARSAQGVHFVVDLSYAGLFGLRNVPDEALGPFMLIEAPRLIFPFARQVIAEAVAGAGFPPLLLDPIDFGAAYMSQLQAAQEDAGEADAESKAAADTPTDA